MQKTVPQEILTGTRFELRRHQAEAAPLIFAAVCADRERLRLFLPWVDGTRKLEDTEEYLRLSAVQWEESRTFDYGIYAGAAYLGNIGVHTISWEDDRAEIGYWLTGEAEGKGYATEAVGLLEKELFRLGFHRVEIRCNARNARSAAVPKRCGFTLEGTLREDVWENGARRDTMVWSKLAAE